MALKIVQTEKKADIPYLNEYVDSLSKSEKKEFDESIHFVHKIKQTPKGFLLETHRFVAFCWKNSSEGKMLTEFLDSVQDASSESILIVIDLDAKYLFAVGVDDELPSIVTFDGKEKTHYFRKPDLSTVTIEKDRVSDSNPSTLKPKGKRDPASKANRETNSRGPSGTSYVESSNDV